MICNGKARGHGSQLVEYLMHSDKNQEVHVLDLSRYDSVADEIASYEADARGSRCRKPFYHAQVRSRDGEHLTQEQFRRAADIYAEAMGFEGLPRTLVVHRYQDHDHLHIVWGRVDPETGRARDYRHDYANQERAGRAMEAEFGLARTRGRFYDEDGQRITVDSERKRSSVRTNKAEQGQLQRTGFDPNERKAAIREIWDRTDSGRAFRAALEEAGYIVAKGDRRDFVIIDRKGEVHSLARQIQGIRAHELRARMVDVVDTNIPSIKQVRAAIRRASRTIERTHTPGLVEKSRVPRERGLPPERVLRPDRDKDASERPVISDARLRRYTEKAAKDIEQALKAMRGVGDVPEAAKVHLGRPEDTAQAQRFRRYMERKLEQEAGRKTQDQIDLEARQKAAGAEQRRVQRTADKERYKQAKDDLRAALVEQELRARGYKSENKP